MLPGLDIIWFAYLALIPLPIVLVMPWAVNTVFRFDLHHDAFKRVSLDLIRRQQLDRHCKLTRAVPNAVMTKALMHVSEVAVDIAQKTPPPNPEPLTDELVALLRPDVMLELKRCRRRSIGLTLGLIPLLIAAGLAGFVWMEAGILFPGFECIGLVHGAALLAILAGLRSNRKIRRALTDLHADYIPAMVTAITGHTLSPFDLERRWNPDAKQLNTHGQSLLATDGNHRLHPSDPPLPFETNHPKERRWSLHHHDKRGLKRTLSRADGAMTLQNTMLTLALDDQPPQSIDLRLVSVVQLGWWPIDKHNCTLQVTLLAKTTRIRFQCELKTPQLPSPHPPRLQSSAPQVSAELLHAVWEVLGELERQRGHLEALPTFGA